MSLTNIKVFKGDIEKMAEAIGISAGLAQKKVAFDLFADIVQRTPVKSGWAHHNWRVTLDSPSTDDPGIPDKNASYPAAVAPALDTGEGEHSIFITNNVVYIQALENGHSKQAPSGMVALAVTAAEANLQQAIASFSP